MGLLAAVGAILILLGVLSLFFHLFATVGAIPLIVIGIIIFVVAHFTGGGGGWYHRGGPGAGPYV